MCLLALAAAGLYLFSQRRNPLPPDWLAAPPATSFLIQFGVGDSSPAVWDGKIAAASGWIFSLEGWRFSGKDTTDGSSTWKVSTRLGQTGGSLVENGIIVSGSFYPTTTFAVDTSQGSFSFLAQDVKYGTSKFFLNKRVLVQQGDGFSSEAIVSFSPVGDWDPAIAASPHGDVAIAWDTYDKGDYDVYFRRMRSSAGIRMDPAVPVAASENFEARSSIAFDNDDRLWVAYEAANVKWGKDFGAYEKTGVALYQGESVKVKCFQDSTPLGTVSQPSLPAGNRASFPQLTVDSDGKVYLAYRGTTGGRSPSGSIWLEKLNYFDGASWFGPLMFPHTKGLLDPRPLMLALAPGDLLMVTAMDHRLSQTRAGSIDNEDWISNDLYTVEMEVSRKQTVPLAIFLSRHLRVMQSWKPFSSAAYTERPITSSLKSGWATTSWGRNSASRNRLQSRSSSGVQMSLPRYTSLKTTSMCTLSDRIAEAWTWFGVTPMR